MAAKPASGEKTLSEADAQARVQAAMDRQAAVVKMLSSLSVSPQDKRAAQAQSKKIESELREARRVLQEAQQAGRK